MSEGDGPRRWNLLKTYHPVITPILRFCIVMAAALALGSLTGMSVPYSVISGLGVGIIAFFSFDYVNRRDRTEQRSRP